MIKKSINPSRISSLNTCFYQGKYNFIIGDLGRGLISNSEPDFELLTCLQIGSLVFLGEYAEAKNIFNLCLKEKRLSDLSRCRCRFYLAVGNVRRSAYDEAVHDFAVNLLEFRKDRESSSPEKKFYAFQGAAFYRYFKGQYNRSVRLAQRAYEAALEMQVDYHQILALDLLGHSLCQRGSTRRGIYEIERALRLAEQIGNGGILVALKISIIKYRAQFGHDMEMAIQELQTAIDSLNPQDTYSKTELHLELSRQLILRGRGKDAQSQLESASALIYSHQNKRQSAMFNLRFAHLLFLRGERLAALTLIQSLRSNLNGRVDRSILCQVDGLERRIHQSQSSSSSSPSPRLESPLSATFMDSRIQHRELKEPFIQTTIGEDPLGDIIDLAEYGHDNALEKIKEFKLYGLLPRALNIPVGIKCLYLGPHRRDLLVVDGSDIYWIDQGVTAPLRKLISLLSGPQFKSKEFLVQNLWGYKYNPLVHDSTLYATIGKLRKILGSQFAWVEWSNEGYRLDPTTRVLALSNHLTNHLTSPQHLPPFSNNVGIPVKKHTPEMDSFNIRQLKLIRRLKPGESISVREYMKAYRICSMTAFRDLASLHKRGHLLKIGKGRATVYAVSVS